MSQGPSSLTGGLYRGAIWDPDYDSRAIRPYIGSLQSCLACQSMLVFSLTNVLVLHSAVFHAGQGSGREALSAVGSGL